MLMRLWLCLEISLSSRFMSIVFCSGTTHLVPMLSQNAVVGEGPGASLWVLRYFLSLTSSVLACCSPWGWYTYTPSSWAPFYPHLPPLWVITEHRAELPVLCSSFPLATCFTHGSVYMLILPTQFVPPSPSPLCLHVHAPCPCHLLFSMRK